MADDLADLRARALAGREWRHPAGPEAVLTVRTPTRLEVRRCAHANAVRLESDGDVGAMLLLLLLARDAIVGWHGVRARDLGGTDDAAPVPFSREAAALWVDANPAHADELALALRDRIAARNAAIEADAKN